MPAESTPLIRIESRLETVEAITQNWAWIGAFGLFNLLFGFVCLSFPVLASQVLELALSYTVFVAGCFHLAAACIAEEGLKLFLLTIGLLQILIAFLMFLNPYGILTLITFFIAVVFMMAGSLQITLSRQNPEMAARGLNFISGVLAIALSVIIMAGFPASSWYTVGILIGVNHVNIGFCRLIMAFYGFSLSRSQPGLDNQENSRSVWPGWMV
jgi:uncharacterized membrane protein HdeD (DUF308 family)